MNKKHFRGTAILASFFVLAMALGGFASAGHNGAAVNVDVPENACGETTISATIADPAGTHKVTNMRLVVDDGDTTQFTDVIPTDGTSVEIAVGPFFADTTVSWRVFGGGERGYDQPFWNGFGGATFSADVNAYGAANGFGFVVAGTDDPNPFTTWNEVEVPGCFPETKEDCMDGGWEAFGFKNQGQCVRFIETGQDSRVE